MKLSLNTGIAYALTFCVLGAGLIGAALSGDWTWFSRCGSVVVVIGILLTSSEILEHQRRLREYRPEREARPRRDRSAGSSAQQVSRDWASAHGIRSLLRARKREEDTWEVEGHGLYMLIFGTLIWGFGDLLGRLFL